MRLHVVSAFTRNGSGGNIAGVVLLSDFPSAEEMQTVAAQAGYSETAFVKIIDSRHQHIRFFAPSAEVALCGHATIASYALLQRQQLIDTGRHTMHCLAGTQMVDVLADGRVAMSQNPPSFGVALPPNKIVSALGMTEADIDPQFPLQIASTGLNKIFVPIRSIRALYQIQPDFDAITQVSLEHNAIGMYCYTKETLHRGTAHCRNFAPVVGIREDSATGTSAAALSTLLFHTKSLSLLGMDETCSSLHFTYEQGYAIDCPAELRVRLLQQPDSRQVTEIWVSGYAEIR